MRIHVPAIPEEGQVVTLDPGTPWLRPLLEQKFKDLSPRAEASGQIEIFKTLQNVSLSGDLRIQLAPPCARCGQLFETTLEVPLQRHLVPYFSDAEGRLPAKYTIDGLHLNADGYAIWKEHIKEFVQ